MGKIGIFIPCYNVQNSVKEVLRSFSPEVLEKIETIVAVDNCSSDDTFLSLKEMQDPHTEIGKRLVVIKNSDNYGLGGSQKIAYQYFLDQKFTHFMIIHGDNQGNGDMIAKEFLKSFDQNKDLDVIYASRFIQGSDVSGYNRLRIWGNLFFNFVTFLLTGCRMSDAGAGIIMYKTKILRELPFHHLTNSSQFNPQLNILIHGMKGIKITEVPLHWHDSSDQTNISAHRYCINLLKILLRYRWNKTFLRRAGWKLFYSQSQQLTPTVDIVFPS